MVGSRLGLVAMVAVTVVAGRAEESAVERGERALLGRSYLPGTLPVEAYANAWKLWGEPKETPKPYADAFARRYGLHMAPYPNNGYPMGLREAPSILGRKAIATDCLLCHGGSIFGKSYVGLGNTSIDIQAFFEDTAAVNGRPGRTPFRFGNVRGTTEAGALSVFLLGLRDADLAPHASQDLGLRDDLCEDAPPWWLMRKKKTMYWTGSGDTRSVRSLMQFMLNPLNTRVAFEQAEPHFADIREYLLSLRPPAYPGKVDRQLAGQGETLFRDNCARCHGTYGESWTYPNKIVPLDVIGTDRTRHGGISHRFLEHYNRSWFARERTGGPTQGYPAVASEGYQAPPLDGIWASAPYLHNGSVPTLYDVLNSPGRPRLYTRSYGTGREDYDEEKVGWKVTTLERASAADVPAYERRKVYDTSQPGRGNGGHTFGDKLSEAERRAVIEYLKTL